MTLTTYADLEQGSQEWLAARCGLLTASTIGKLITPSTLKVADNETSRGLTMTLAAERITGHVEHVHPTADMQRGTDDEPFARAVYAEHFAPVEEIGFMVRDLGSYKIGFSPDGLVGDDGLIEIKSRNPKEHLKTILKGLPPLENVAQLQAGLFVSGREWVDYVSFCAGLPLWVKRVYPDTRWVNAITTAAAEFEINVTNIVNNFNAATEGLPMTERRATIEEITFSAAYYTEHPAPRSVIPDDACYITWLCPQNGEERIAMRYGHHANRVWRMGHDNYDEKDLVEGFIGNSMVTVLEVREP